MIQKNENIFLQVTYKKKSLFIGNNKNYKTSTLL
jgi:hypothetical protein